MCETLIITKSLRILFFSWKGQFHEGLLYYNQKNWNSKRPRLLWNPRSGWSISQYQYQCDYDWLQFRVPKRYLPVKKGFPRIPGGTHLLCKDLGCKTILGDQHLKILKRLVYSYSFLQTTRLSARTCHHLICQCRLLQTQFRASAWQTARSFFRATWCMCVQLQVCSKQELLWTRDS